MINKFSIEKLNVSNFVRFDKNQKCFSPELVSFQKTVSSQDISLNVRPVIAMWRAVILQAIVDAVTESKKSEAKSIRKKARDWINIDNPDFVEVCRRAHYSPKYVIQKATFAIANASSWKKNCRNLKQRPTIAELNRKSLDFTIN